VTSDLAADAAYHPPWGKVAARQQDEQVEIVGRGVLPKQRTVDR
jgi:hypothetical protein